MPIYEYRCRKCGHQFETMQKVSDRPLRRCPECSGGLEKLFSRTSFQLKGSGWYAQGYESSGSKAKSTKGGSKSKKKKSGDSGETKGSSGDSKSDSKGDPKSGAAA